LGLPQVYSLRVKWPMPIWKLSAPETPESSMMLRASGKRRSSEDVFDGSFSCERPSV
jgi:hypothetical protein